ncbi:hypothetical protein HY003_00195 [Candidatus Saccharibacteria bacterium]|nr:hypothetical protein [Candidatus Saccharibacteria bacterium]MBI3337711.1 hypothetical protein [Candidatus Saccharibacteria bacterium]
MKRTTKKTALFLGLSVNSLLFPVTHGEIESINPEYHTQPETTMPVSTDKTAPIQTILPDIVKVEPVPTSLIENQEDNKQYIETTIIPVLEEAGLRIVPPTNVDFDPVNAPNQFIVTNDGKCGSQFSVIDSNKPDTKNITIEVFGELDILENGKEYVTAAFDNRLGHQEVEQVDGHDFLKEDPASVKQFVEDNNNAMCQVMMRQP